ncbi:hypothetical protein RND71_024479 [Anisodus tanguticus]|uniref:Cupin type-1 domain-containing protein n=1 Tax=Anisodus tanguticus TaxID=243964 RepID=A0AAE1V421_9SOLA|nr:hypothetical protein RND71_024479 [Anisodus tanguticus]
MSLDRELGRKNGCWAELVWAWPKMEHSLILHSSKKSFTDTGFSRRSWSNYHVLGRKEESNRFRLGGVSSLGVGRGTLNLVRRGKRNSFNIRPGDVIRVHAGTTAYLINRDNNENLVIAKLLRPHFFGPGGRENPESFYNAFSSEILEAALNTRRDRLQRLFGQQREGVIIRASEEQIRQMSQQEGGIWPFGGESKGSVNIFKQRPSQSNQYGQFHEGGMLGPIYSSRATKIAVVVDGEGYFEMACPHLASESGRRQGSQERETRIGTSYQKVAQG